MTASSEWTPPALPVGVRDFLPNATLRRRRLADGAITAVESWGFERVITPNYEVADVIARGLGAGALDRTIRFIEPGSGQIVALRPDITPQIARLVATRMAQRQRPIRLCYDGTVTRIGAEGSPREVLQIGAELIGKGTPGTEASVLAALTDALCSTSLPGAVDVRLDIGDVRLVGFVLAQAAPLVDTTRLRTALTMRDQATASAIAKQLPSEIANVVEFVMRPPATIEEVGKAARSLPKQLVAFVDELAQTIAAYRQICSTPLPIIVDLGETRGFGYYTGLRFAAFVRGASDAVARGGRYDNLLGKFGRDETAIGFALDVEALAQAQKNAGIARPGPALTVVITDSKLASAAAALRLRGARVIVDEISASDRTTALASGEIDCVIAQDPGWTLFSKSTTVDVSSAVSAAQANDINPLFAAAMAVRSAEG